MTYYIKAEISKQDFEQLINKLKISTSHYCIIYQENDRDVAVATDEEQLSTILLELYGGELTNGLGWSDCINTKNGFASFGGNQAFLSSL